MDIIKRVSDQPAPRGLDVAQIQMMLLRRGILDNTDPAVLSEINDQMYGMETERAVKVFQAQRGLVVDGAVGPNTLRQLQGLDPSRSVNTMLPKFDAMARLPAEMAHIMYGWYRQAQNKTAYIENPIGSNFGNGIMTIQQWFDPVSDEPCPDINHLRRKLGFDTSSSSPRDLNRLRSIYRLFNIELEGEHPTDEEVKKAVQFVCVPSFTYPGCIKYFGLAWCALTVAAACQAACDRLGVENPIGYHTVWGSGSTVSGWYDCALRAGLLADDVRPGQVGCIGQPDDLHHLVFVADVSGGKYLTLEGNCDNRVSMMLRDMGDLAYTINLPEV